MIMQIHPVKNDFNYTHNHVSYTHTHTHTHTNPKSRRLIQIGRGKKLLRITDIMKINCRICPQIKNLNIFSWNLFKRNYQELHLYPKTQCFVQEEGSSHSDRCPIKLLKNKENYHFYILFIFRRKIKL